MDDEPATILETIWIQAGIFPGALHRLVVSLFPSYLFTLPNDLRHSLTLRGILFQRRGSAAIDKAREYPIATGLKTMRLLREIMFFLLCPLLKDRHFAEDEA